MGIIEIVLYISLTLLLLVVLGYGLCVFFLPKKTQPYILWLSPWCAVTSIIFFGVFLGLLGLTTQQWAPAILIILSALSYKAFHKQDFKIPKISNIDIFIIFILLTTILLNLSPLFLQQKFLTTLSMGNTDAQAYALVPDYLKTHSLLASFRASVPQAVYGLIQFGYRWGPSVLASFFLTIFNLAGYQFITILQAILFSMSLPLVAILWRLLYGDSKYGIILSLFIISLNVNLLYFLYHNFFGQTIFLGINLIFIILLILYEPIKIFVNNTSQLTTRKNWNKLKEFIFKHRFVNKQDIVITTLFSVLFFSYSEASIFILFPMGMIVLVKILKRNEFINYTVSYGKILLLTFLFGSLSIVHAFKFMIGFRIQDFYKPIGWQVFRQKNPFVNPFEALSLYSIHSFEPLYSPLALLLSAFTIYVIYKGLIKSERKDIISGFLIVYLVFFITFSFIKPNFWAYNRAVSYAIPLLAILFVGGIVEIFKNKLKLQKIVFFLLFGALVFNVYKLNKQYNLINLAVDKSLVSLKELSLDFNNNIIYSENVIQNTRPIWDELWMEYFLEPRLNIINSIEAQKSNKKISNGDLIIVSKTSRYTPQTKILLSKIIWENSYFKIGQLCSSDLCLEKSQLDLSGIIIGKSIAEDILLIQGWEPRELDHRWISSSEASLKLITKKPTNKILFKIRSLAIPQQMVININNEKETKIGLSVDWKTYIITLVKPLTQGVHSITLKFDHTYRPSEILHSADTRTLFADFKEIQLK